MKCLIRKEVELFNPTFIARFCDGVIIFFEELVYDESNLVSSPFGIVTGLLACSYHLFY